MFSILVIDDDDKSRKALCEKLAEYGDVSLVREANSAAEALLALESFVPDAVLLDVVMPVMDGLETLVRIRFDKRFDKTIIIMMSSIMLDHVADKAMSCGANYCLCKPVDASLVYQCVKKLIITDEYLKHESAPIDEAALQRQSIISRLDDIGLDASGRGYELLFDSIVIACGLNHIYDIKLVDSVYEQVARKHKITISCAERNMRDAIKKAWDKNPEKMADALCVNRRPATGDLVAKVAHMTKYWM